MHTDQIDTAAVLGLGIMGHGIAQTFATAGLTVRCFDVAEQPRSSLHNRVRANLRRFEQAGLIGADAIEPALGRLAVYDDERDAVSGAQYVVEAVREDLETKQQLFARIEPWVSQDCVLASNTSTFPMTEIAAGLRHPQRAINTHWFNPPHICPLVEVVPGEKTSAETAETTIALHERIGKMPIRINQELPGFLVNRIQIALMREVLDLLERGVASAEDIDRAVRGSMGMRLAAVGPLAVWDFGGLDTAARVYEHLVRDIRSDRELPKVIEKLMADGLFGLKTGKGFFEYLPTNSAEIIARRDGDYIALLKLSLRESDDLGDGS